MDGPHFRKKHAHDRRNGCDDSGPCQFAKECLGSAVHAINRTADNNNQTGFPPNFSRLEKWKGKDLPGQTKGLYPLGCLAFKHVPLKLRTKLDEHATPSVYLGLNPQCRAYLLGSLFNLDLSTSVEVTFVENVFPFRKVKHRESPASLLWGTDNNLSEGDPRLGMFDAHDSSGVSEVLDRSALKSLGVVPGSSAELEVEEKPSVPLTLFLKLRHDVQADLLNHLLLSRCLIAFRGRTTRLLQKPTRHQTSLL